MIYMKILKKGGSREKGGGRKRNPCPMRLWIEQWKDCGLKINIWCFLVTDYMENFKHKIWKTSNSSCYSLLIKWCWCYTKSSKHVFC
jgi:hypothetical protein